MYKNFKITKIKFSCTHPLTRLSLCCSIKDAGPSCEGNPTDYCVSLQRTYRMPKEIRVEPQKFAEELIHRLEAVQRTREAEEKLEERLKRVRMVSGLYA